MHFREFIDDVTLPLGIPGFNPKSHDSCHMTHVVSNRTSETANYITFEMNSRGAKFLNSLGFLCSRKTFKKFHYPIAERF